MPKFNELDLRMLSNSVPTVFTDSLSYYEQILQFLSMVNELIRAVNELNDSGKIYTDQQIELLRAWVQTQLDAIDQRASQLNIDLRQLIQYNKDEITGAYTQLITERVATLNLRITGEVGVLNTRISDEVDTLNARISYEVDQLKAYIASQLIDIKVIDPMTGQIATIQQALYSIANMFRTDALTAGEYDAKELTAGAYDALMITAFDYDYNGKTLIP